MPVGDPLPTLPNKCPNLDDVGGTLTSQNSAVAAACRWHNGPGASRLIGTTNIQRRLSAIQD
jgi:hypothetical protein